MPHHATYAVPNELLDVAVIDDSKTMQGIIRSMLNAMKVRRVRLFDSTEAALHSMLHEPARAAWNATPPQCYRTAGRAAPSSHSASSG